MLESVDTSPSFCLLVSPTYAEQADQVKVTQHIGFFTCFHGISLKHSRFRKSPFYFSGSHIIVLKPLVSLIGHLLAGSASICVDKHTDQQRDLVL